MREQMGKVTRADSRLIAYLDKIQADELREARENDADAPVLADDDAVTAQVFTLDDYDWREVENTADDNEIAFYESAAALRTVANGVVTIHATPSTDSETNSARDARLLGARNARLARMATAEQVK